MSCSILKWVFLPVVSVITGCGGSGSETPFLQSPSEVSANARLYRKALAPRPSASAPRFDSPEGVFEEGRTPMPLPASPSLE